MAVIFNVEIGGRPISHITKLEAYKIEGTEIIGTIEHEIYDYYELYQALIDLDNMIEGDKVYSCGLFSRDMILKDIEYYKFEPEFKLLMNTLRHNHRTIKDLYTKYIDNTCRNSKEMVCNMRNDDGEIDTVRIADLAFVYISILSHIEFELLQIFDSKRMRKFLKDFNQIHALNYSIQRRGNGFTIKDNFANKVDAFNKFELLRALAHIVVIDYYEHDFKYVSQEEYEIFKDLADIDGFHHMYI